MAIGVGLDSFLETLAIPGMSNSGALYRLGNNHLALDKASLNINPGNTWPKQGESYVDGLRECVKEDVRRVASELIKERKS